MINTCQVALVEADYSEPFEDRVDILFRELELATKWHCPSLLLAIYSSEYVHGDAQLALENRLLDLGQKAHHIVVKSQDDSDIPLLISELADLGNAVVFVEGLRWGCGESDFCAYQALNKHREFFIENRIRVVFWLTETEAIHLAHHAPDYWTFRHRVIEFVDSPRPEQIPSQVMEPAWQGMGDFADSSEDLDAKITLRTALLTDLPDGDESTAARANLLLTLGILHWRRGDYDRAAQFLHTALSLAAKLQDNPFEALCYNALALVETALGRLKEAIQAYQTAMELAPAKISPWNNLGNLHYKLAHYEEAFTAFQKAVEQNPSDFVSWSGLGDTHYKLGRHEDAIYAFQKSLELTPNNAHSWSSLGDVYADEGQLDDAFAAYQKALGIDRCTTASWLGLGDVYRQQGSLENATLAYQTAIEIDPANAHAWDRLGDIHHNAGAFGEAIHAYQKAIELDHGCEQSYNNLASIYLQDGNYAEAIPLLRKGIELQSEPAEAALLWNRLGEAYRKLDDYDNAIEAYRKADELETVVPATSPSAGPLKEDSATLAACPDLEIGPAELEPPEPAGPTLVPETVLPIDGPNPVSDIITKNESIVPLSDPEPPTGTVELLTPEPAGPTRVLETILPVAGSDTGMAVTAEDDPIAPPPDPEPATATVELLTPETVAPATESTSDNSQMIDDTGTMTDESEVDFARWLEGLVTRMPLPADPEETGTPAQPSIEDEQTHGTETLSETTPALLKVSQPSEPEPACLAFDTTEISFPVDKDALTSAEAEAVDPLFVKEASDALLPQEGQIQTTSTIAETAAGDCIPPADFQQEEDPADTHSKNDPKSAQIWNELGNIYYNIVAYDEAINALNKAIELDHSYGWAYNNLASIYIHKGSYEEAIPLLKQGIHMLSEAKDKALLWNRLGDAFRRMDQRDQAAAAYKMAMELDPENVSLLTRARFSLLGNRRASSQEVGEVS